MSTVLAAVITALAASGCGRSAGARPAPATGTAVTSVRCSEAATSAGPSAVPGRCVFVLIDGRRFRCPDAAFAASVPTVGVLERAPACAPLKRLAISASERRVFARLAAARACLTGKGLRVTGGPAFPRNPGTPDAPDGELIVGARSGAAFIGFFRDARVAGRREAAVLANAQRLGGQAERWGPVTVVWVHPPATGLRADVQTCAVG